MTLNIDIPEEIARKLADQAAKSGTEPTAYVLKAVERSLAEADRLDRVLGPVRTAYADSGVNDDALSDLLEDEKHALRRGE